MTLVDRLAALRTAPDESDLAAVLGVAPAELELTGDGLTVAGESITYAEAWRILRGVDLGDVGRSVKIEDLCRINSPS